MPVSAGRYTSGAWCIRYVTQCWGAIGHRTKRHWRPGIFLPELKGSQITHYTVQSTIAWWRCISKKSGTFLALASIDDLTTPPTAMVSSTAFQAFSCEEFENGKSFLRADFAVECGTTKHNDAIALAWVGIVLYPIGISVLYILLLCKAKRAILDAKPTALSRALRDGHEKNNDVHGSLHMRTRHAHTVSNRFVSVG